jgi:hypothetical protein
MNTVVARSLPGRFAKLLAVLSVACFWFLPLSPMVAIGAVSMAKGVSDWSRKFAVTGAILCIVHTIVMALPGGFHEDLLRKQLSAGGFRLYSLLDGLIPVGCVGLLVLAASSLTLGLRLWSVTALPFFGVGAAGERACSHSDKSRGEAFTPGS